MKRNHEDKYRLTDQQLHAFLRRSDEIFSDNQPHDDQDQALVVDNEAAIEHALAMLDDDAPASSSPVSSDSATDRDVAPGAAPTVPNYGDMIRNWRAERTRKKARNRQRAHRAKVLKPGKAVTSYGRLFSALKMATAKTQDKQLEQLRGREEELAGFCHRRRTLTAEFGPMSDADVALRMNTMAVGRNGILRQIDRNAARRLRKIVEDLEAEGEPWHNL